MKTTILILVFLLLTQFVIAQGKYAKLEPIVKIDSVVKSKDHFFKYGSSIDFYNEFIALDTHSNVVEKSEFFEMIEKSNFIPLQLNASKMELPVYRLERFTSQQSEDYGIIADILKLMGKQFAFFERWKGHPLPDYQFTDLTGTTYTKEETKGKVVVLKCWFTGCKPCIREMPELNQVVAQYDQKDVLFISIAFEDQETLREFFQKKNIDFDYAIVANQENYIKEKIGVMAYPTHIIVGRDGKVKAMSNSAPMVKKYLDQNYDSI